MAGALVFVRQRCGATDDAHANANASQVIKQTTVGLGGGNTARLGAVTWKIPAATPRVERREHSRICA